MLLICAVGRYLGFCIRRQIVHVDVPVVVSIVHPYYEVTINSRLPLSCGVGCYLGFCDKLERGDPDIPVVGPVIDVRHEIAIDIC
ncbi:hypothetical protein ES703_94636 [subsurface metagenome]